MIRGDAGFCREAIMAWCEANQVHYVLGLVRNKRLQRALGKEMEAARAVHERTDKPARRFRDFRYRTRKSWSRERRVVGKAEYLPNKANPRFVVTNLSLRQASAKRLYEQLVLSIIFRFFCWRWLRLLLMQPSKQRLYPSLQAISCSCTYGFPT